MLDIMRGNLCYFKGIKLETVSVFFRLSVHSNMSTVSSKLSITSGCVWVCNFWSLLLNKYVVANSQLPKGHFRMSQWHQQDCKCSKELVKSLFLMSACRLDLWDDAYITVSSFKPCHSWISAHQAVNSSRWVEGYC